MDYGPEPWLVHNLSCKEHILSRVQARDSLIFQHDGLHLQLRIVYVISYSEIHIYFVPIKTAEVSEELMDPIDWHIMFAAGKFMVTDVSAESIIRDAEVTWFSNPFEVRIPLTFEKPKW